MSHTVYETEAFVVGKEARGETNAVLRLFTRHHGCIYVHASGVRKLQSKLRGHLSKYSLVRVSLVRGRDRWVLVGAEEIPSLPVKPKNGERFHSQVRILAFVSRYLVGEEKDELLFETVFGGVSELVEAPVTRVADIELRTIARACAKLGYIAEREFGEPMSEATRIALAREINNALQSSHL